LQNSFFDTRKLIPNRSVSALTDRTGALQNCISLIPKTKRDPESGSWNSINSFILINMAERVGFEPTLPFRVNTLSKLAPSPTRPSLLMGLAAGSEAQNALTSALRFYGSQRE